MNSPFPSPSPSPSPYPPPFLFRYHHNHHVAAEAAIAAAAASVVILLLLLVLLICHHRRKNKKYHASVDHDNDNLSTTAILHASSHPLFNIEAATDGFRPSLVVGKGRLGTVYRATSVAGHLFAVKRIHSHLILTNAGLDFSSKLKSLSYTNHPNVVPVLGFSQGPGERIIITEFAGPRSLAYYLFNDVGEVLDWARRARIAAGAARGLEHLHAAAGVGVGIVHGRVKPSNILIDENYCARVCDYGLSFLDQNYTNGLYGYLDGEGGEESSKPNDVYGLGVVLLEMLSGRKSDGGLLVEWALPLIRVGRVEEVLDSRLRLPADVTPLVRMAKVASACVGNGRRSRPVIGQVAAILSSLEREKF